MPALSGAVAVILLAWWWPTLVRDPGRTDVAVVGGRDVATASDAIARHVRQRGLGVVVTGDLDPCDAAGVERAAAGARFVVLTFPTAAITGCEESFAVLRDRFDDAAVQLDGSTPLAPIGTEVRLGCEWWEPPAPAAAVANCDPDGLITVRDGTGDLTIAGHDRLGRIVAGAVP